MNGRIHRQWWQMKHFEFWQPRLFELPYYLYLLFGATVRGLTIKSLAKANYVLDHGEIGIGSKYLTQLAFDQELFLPTRSLPVNLTDEEKCQLIAEFALEVGYPLILKSDIGSVGKGVVKLSSIGDVRSKVPKLMGPNIVQQYCEWKSEYGVFYIRQNNKPRITGINKKHFPTIVGDGRKTVGQLAQEHPRYTAHWRTFLQYLDEDEILAQDKSLQISFIGSHTMGCKFTDDTHLLNEEIARRIYSVFESQPGFNFGRLDVKAENEEAFMAGKFAVIEVNGVASLPTNMFDPDNSLWRAYKIFLSHGRYLLDIASEHRGRKMTLDSYSSIIRRVRTNAQLLNASHQALMDT
jgi:hypothetical protein